MPKEIIKNQENLDLVIKYKPNLANAKGLVFIEHGFTGHKDEPQIKIIGKTFANEGYSVVLFDVTNSTGESGNNTRGTRFSDYYNDLQDVITWAKKQKWYTEPFTLCGHSLGGLSVINYTANHPEQVKLLIPISPAVNGESMYNAMKELMGEKFTLWENGGSFTRHSKTTGKSVEIPFSAISEIKKCNAQKLNPKIKCQTVLINGDQDTSTPLEETRNFYEQLNCPKDLKIIKNCAHIIRSKDNLKDLQNYLLEIINKDVSSLNINRPNSLSLLQQYKQHNSH